MSTFEYYTAIVAGCFIGIPIGIVLVYVLVFIIKAFT